MVGLRNLNYADRNAEVGYWVSRKYWGMGLATEAVYLMLWLAFSRLGFRRVYAVVHADNVASYRVLEKNCFSREAIWRKASFLGRRWRDVYGYGILVEEHNSPSGEKE